MHDLPPVEPGYMDALTNGAASNGNGTAPEPKRRATDSPVFSIDAETAVIGALMMEPEAIAVARQVLEPRDFFEQRHRLLFVAACALADERTPVEPLTLADWLEQQGDLARVGGREYIGYLIDVVTTAANVGYHAKIVKRFAERRALTAALDRLRTAASDPALDPRTLAAELLEQLGRADEASGLPKAIRALDAPASEPVTWCIEDLWTTGDIGLIVGDGGSFKSSAALHMAAAIAGGYRVFGWFPVAEARPVMIVSAEDALPVVMMRLEAFIAGHGWSREKVLANVHIVATPDATLSDPRWQAHLLAEAKRIRPGFIVLDPLADLLGGDENANTDVRPVMKFARQLAAVAGSATAIVHHAGKAGTDKRTLDRIRGASAINAAARVILFFEFRPDGVRVENLKMTKAAKLEPFVVKREIETVPGNRAMWTSAALSYVTAKEHMRTRGEQYVLERLRQVHPTRLTSGDLRDGAQDTSLRVSTGEVASALRTLTNVGVIDYVPGKQGSKWWGFLDRTVAPAVAVATSNGSRTGSPIVTAEIPDDDHLSELNPDDRV